MATVLGNAATAPGTAPHHTTTYEWYQYGIKRAILAIIYGKTAFLGRNVYRQILAFLRNFSLQELATRLDKILNARFYNAAKIADNHCEFCWSSKKDCEKHAEFVAILPPVTPPINGRQCFCDL